MIWSAAASQSHWVELEWTNALSLRKTIIPCRVDQTPLPALLANVLYIDCRDFENGFLQLREALHLELPSAAQPSHEKPEPASTIKERRIDAAVPGAAEVGRPIDLRVQVRFPDSPRLGLEDWPAKNKPAHLEQAAENVTLEFPVDAATGKFSAARLEIHVVAPDFDIAGNAKQVLLVPPDALSKCLSFLLTPKRAGVCRLNVEVYNIEHIFLGAIPIETEVGGEVKVPATNVANLFLLVTVGQEKAATRSGGTYSKTKKIPRPAPQIEPKEIPPPAPAPSQPASGVHFGGNKDIAVGGDIIGQDQKPASKKSFRKSLAWLSATLGVLMALIVLQQMTPKSADIHEGAMYYGVVLDENGNGIVDATIEVKAASDSTRLLASGQSLSNGEFSVLIKVKRDSTVWVKISKAGYKDVIGIRDLKESDKAVLSKLRNDP